MTNGKFGGVLQVVFGWSMRKVVGMMLVTRRLFGMEEVRMPLNLFVFVL